MKRALFWFCLIATPALAGPFTPGQQRVLALVAHNAPAADVRALEGIALTETRAGRDQLVGDLDRPVGFRSYGIMQVRMVVAREVLAANADLWPGYTAKIPDELVIAKLIMDRAFCVRVASRHWARLRPLFASDDQTALAYNAGLTAYQEGRSSPKYRQRFLDWLAVLDKIAAPQQIAQAAVPAR